MSSSAFIVLKLLPQAPVDVGDWANYISNLTITAYDLTVQNESGASVGTATTAVSSTPPAHTLNPSIWADNELLLPVSSATAVFVVDATIKYYDLRFVAERGRVEVDDSTIEYNISPTVVTTLNPDPNYYTDIAPPHAYFQLPPPSDPSLPSIPSGANGQPPQFEDVLVAVNTVLGSSHSSPSTTLQQLGTPLTLAQCMEIAADIVWDRVANPVPIPAGNTVVGSLYTLPSATAPPPNPTALAQFGSQLSGYYSSFNSTTSSLAPYIFAASAAICCEQESSSETMAGLTFPIIPSSTGTGTSAPSSVTGAIQSSSVVVSVIPDPKLTAPPHWTVPAAYFYILGAVSPPQILFSQRYTTAISMTESQLLDAFNAAVANGLLPSSVAPVTEGDSINAAQAARRLVALGSTDNSVQVSAVTIQDLMYVPGTPASGSQPAASPSGWLGYTGSDINSFWTNAASNNGTSYTTLVLQAITQGATNLVTQLLTPSSSLYIPSVSSLQSIGDDKWTTFFNNSPVSLLPPFTAPGSVQQRVSVFLTYLHRFFTSTTTTSTPPTVQPTAISTFGVPTTDVLALFINEYTAMAGEFSFGTPFDATALETALKSIFPKRPESRDWLRKALSIVQTLVQMTSTCVPSTGGTSMQFSIMEGLYACGFVNTESVNNLTLDQFTKSLAGTIAYEYASMIQKQSLLMDPTQVVESESESESTVVPVNPGSLTNCNPPPNLSPFGPIQYLHEMLGLHLGDAILESYVSNRRGPLGNLQTTIENLTTPVPCIDLVNESLEAMVGDLNGSGAIFDTMAQEKYVTAVPQYSSPATPVANPSVYDILKQCFTSPQLPYPQSLDICRSYLRLTGSNRFETMRRFRQDITEFAIDAACEPSDFQASLWRLPVCLDLALEYLGLSQEECRVLFTGSLSNSEFTQLLDFDESAVLAVSGFLKFTGLDYKQFFDLQRCHYVSFTRDKGTFPECEPCNLEELRISFGKGNLIFLLRKLFTFVRLWRRLGQRVTFNQLADICIALELFKDETVNDNFIRELAALLMLQSVFNLPWAAKVEEKSTGAGRTQLLALWTSPEANPVEWSWAVKTLLAHIQSYAKRRYGSSSGFTRDIRENLGRLSFLAGFTEQDNWHAKPTCTIRFAEVLSKICASRFTVGEINFLFTAEPHVRGEDSFVLPTPAESILDPLNLPEDNRHGLWKLRAKLLTAEIREEESWTWHRIEDALRHLTLRLPEHSLRAVAEHFFPCALKHHGDNVPRESRQFRVKLSKTTPAEWNHGDGPFRYDVGTGELWLHLPVSDDQVIAKLRQTRQLTPEETSAVQNLYFAPRAALAPFALIFSNFRYAVSRLVTETSEEERFRFFQAEFAIFHQRCHIIARHLTEHVAAVMGQECPEHPAAAQAVLRHLLADENRAKEDWEADSGVPPTTFRWNALSGSSYAALLGLVGTGLLEEFECNSQLVWRNVTGDLTFFGQAENQANAPVPTLIPSLSLALTPKEEKFASVVNGFAIRNDNGHPLGGAQPYKVKWTGSLLVEHPGEYVFHGGAPKPTNEVPDFEHVSHHHWVIVLRRGEKTWVVLNNGWIAHEAPNSRSVPLFLRRGSYDIEICFGMNVRLTETLLRPLETGFQVKYTGPDTDGELMELPITKLFRMSTDSTLDDNIKASGSAIKFLEHYFTSSLRDIRRTYQRAFKGLLFALRFKLSAETPRPGLQSELSVFLHAPENFIGTCYYRSAPSEFSTHHAFFDLNFLPVTDFYTLPNLQCDSRVEPSLKREAALFDWWERIFDYCDLRNSLHEQPVWMLFYDAAVQQPRVPDPLLRYLDVDIGLARQVFSYYDSPTTKFTVQTSMLSDERWAIRVRHAGDWMKELNKRFYTKSAAHNTLPYLWVSDDPSVVLGDTSGNTNMTHFFHESFDRGNDKQIKQINDGLRQRARTTLLAYLCNKNRIRLPFRRNAFAESPRDLSDLLLQDVQVGLARKTTRIEDALSAIRTFIQRCRIGLEPEILTPQFLGMWDKEYATFESWKIHKRREVYPENWIQWEELEKAGKSEGFRVLRDKLRADILSIPKPGGLVWWSDATLPYSGYERLQTQERTLLYDTSESTTLHQIPNSDGEAHPEVDATKFMDVVTSSDSDGLGVLAHPEFDGQLSWVGPSTSSAGDLPLWIKAAVKMGTRFVVVHAANPPGSGHSVIDKFYFWLADSQFFQIKDMKSDATLGATPPDPSCYWDHPEEYPGLLQWPPQAMVHLYWCRVHLGRFESPRRSSQGFPSSNPTQLIFLCRQADSLYFAVGSGSTPNFRYDMFNDSAIPAPQPPSPSAGFPQPLQAYPFFMYFEPGSPLIPSNYGTAIAVASSLRSQGRFEAALKWLEVPFNPINANNDWKGHSVRNRGILLEYLEILLSWGESLSESPQEAQVIFNLAEQILGRPPRRINADGDHTTVNAFQSLPPPLNPRLSTLYDRLGDHYSDCNGSANGDLAEYNVSCHRRYPYRFTSLLPRALQLVDMTKSLGAALLSAFEKGDAEYLASLQTTYSRQLLELDLESKMNQVRESEWQVQGMEQGLNGALCRLNYYTQLIQNGLNSDENDYNDTVTVTLASLTGATVAETIAEIDSIGPNEYLGSVDAEVIELSQLPVGGYLGHVSSIAARICHLASEISSTTGQSDLTNGEWARRAADWQEQVNVITIEIQQLERQKLAADRQRAMSLRDLNNHQQDIEHSIDIQNFVRDKFTKQDLYLFLQQETSVLYRRSYDLALKAGRQTQRLFWYERGDDRRDFLPESPWDGLQEGLLAGERLEQGLQSMEQAYMEENCREYELIKYISLWLYSPTAFLRLKTTGVCEIDIPEWIYDLDYPGHYMRRIKAVTITIPCVSGPFAGVHCRMQLLSSCIRTEPYLSDGQYEQLPHDPRFARQYGATQGIATSTGQSDPGLFELSFNDERYLPFEFAGAVSKWRIELPPENNQFDLNTVSDFVIQLNYTAREGGDALRDAASKMARQHLPANGWRLFDFRQEFASPWSVYLDARRRNRFLSFPIKLDRSMFPFIFGRRDLYVASLDFFVQVSPAKDGEHLKLRYLEDGREEEIFEEIICVVDAEWPGLYHGRLCKVLGPVGSKPFIWGRIQFPEHVVDICEVYMLCRYKVQGEGQVDDDVVG